MVDTDGAFRTIAEALDVAYDDDVGEVFDVVIIPPPNPEDPSADTDTEDFNEDLLDETPLAEVAGTLEVHSSRGISKSPIEEFKKMNGKEWKKLSTKQKEIEIKRREKTLRSKKTKEWIHTVKQNLLDQFNSLNVDGVISASEQLGGLHLWTMHDPDMTDKDDPDMNDNRHYLHWLAEVPVNQRKSRQGLLDKFNGKDPVYIFESLFTEEIRDHICVESIRYARQHNSQDFTLSENDLKKFIGILLLTGYHSLPQTVMYWKRTKDVCIPAVSECMSRNRFKEMKRYLHLANNELLAEDSSDRLFKIRKFHDLMNQALMQFGPWHKDMSNRHCLLMSKWYPKQGALIKTNKPRKDRAVRL